MRTQFTQIICDVCNREVSEVANTSMYRPDFLQSISIKNTGDGERFDDICGHCSDSLISALRGLQP